jgi:RNA polymerase sigma factor (sigma-70 family)
MVSVVSRFGLGREDAADVEQTVWLRLVQNLHRIREPAALPGWIQTTVRNEAIRIAGSRRTVPLSNDSFLVGEDDALESEMLATERREALLGAVAQLPGRQYELLMMLIADPTPSYDEISSKLGMPKGSIGPTRARAMERLRGLLEGIGSTAPLEGETHGR